MDKKELNYRLIEVNCCANCKYLKTYTRNMTFKCLKCGEYLESTSRYVCDAYERNDK